MAPSPVLSDDDPVLANIISLAGFTLNGQNLTGAEGLTLSDAKRAAYLTRDHDLQESMGVADDRIVRSDVDGWAADTELRFVDDGTIAVINSAGSQPVYGMWQLDVTESDAFDTIQVRGFTYDVYAAAATLCEALGARLKQQFNFNDGSGSYQREQKYSMTMETARMLWKKARIKSVDLVREDMGAGMSFADWFFAQKLYPPGWA